MNPAPPCICILGAALAGCTFDDDIRGTDRSALLPSARVRWAMCQPSAPSDPERVSYQSMLAASLTHVDGDFDRAGTRADYRVTNGHVAFAPEVSWRHVHVGPFAGLAYGDIEVESGAARGSADGLGGVVGIQASWRGWQPFEPYVRYAEAGDPKWKVARFEAGVDVRVFDQVGVQFAYARQTSHIEQLFTATTGARIESEGVHVGMSLRF